MSPNKRNMKKSPILLLLIAIIFILQATPAIADKPKVKGYYIDVAGQKKEIMIQVPTKMLNKKEVDNIQRNYFTTFDKRGKETKLTAENATEFGFTFNG